MTETRVRDGQYWSALVAADRTMNPCPLDGIDQRARHVLAACIEPDGPVDADGDQARVIDDARHPAFLPGGERRHGRGTRPPGRSCDGRDGAGERWTPSTGQLIDVAKWNLLRYLPVKMRGAEDDKAETAKSFASL